MTSRANQGGFQDWSELRNHLIEAYGSTPHPASEQTIISAYELHPDAVTKAALDLIGAIGITSPWGVLKSRATKISTPPANPTHDHSSSREKRIARAKTWIRTTGCHYDRESEILLELFDGPSTLLGNYAHIELIEDHSDAGKWKLAEPTGDLALITRITHAWNQARPTGIAIEQETIARAETYKQHQRELAAALAKAKDDIAAKQPAPDLPFR